VLSVYPHLQWFGGRTIGGERVALHQRWHAVDAHSKNREDLLWRRVLYLDLKEKCIDSLEMPFDTMSFYLTALVLAPSRHGSLQPMLSSLSTFLFYTCFCALVLCKCVVELYYYRNLSAVVAVPFWVTPNLEIGPVIG